MERQKNRRARRITHVALDSIDSILAGLSSSIEHPHEIDEAISELGIDPLLLNPLLSERFDLSSMGLGEVTHIPVQISNKDGGRKSLYFLRPGESTISGLLISRERVFFRITKRDTGSATPAEAGDRYQEEYRCITGECIATMQGPLEVIDKDKGHGRIRFEVKSGADGSSTLPPPQICEWFFFSLYARCKPASLATG